MPFERAQVIGGCSAHNSGVQTWGHRGDYEAWAEAAGPAWSAESMRPAFERATAQLRVETYSRRYLTPWQDAWFQGFLAADLPELTDLNDLDEAVGVAPDSVNIVDGVRFNTAFAYLDPLREDARLSIRGDVLVDRLLLEGERAVGVLVRHGGRGAEVRAGTVVLSAGSFCTPAVLQRSGIGASADLRRQGISVAVDLRGSARTSTTSPSSSCAWRGQRRSPPRCRPTRPVAAGPPMSR